MSKIGSEHFPDDFDWNVGEPDETDDSLQTVEGETPDPFFDTEETVSRFLQGEFSSVIETEEKEARIEQILEVIPDRLRKFGLDNASVIDAELIDELMGYGYEDIDDIENLYFYTWDMFRREFGTFNKAKIEYMMDVAEDTNSDRVEKEQNNSAISKLIEIGIDANSIFDRPGTPEEKRKLRRLTWILDNEPSLEELIEGLKKTKKIGSAIDPDDLSEHIKTYLGLVKEGMDGIDIEKMTHFDRLKHKGQVAMLKCSIALSDTL